jgi:hypothetical protein
MVTILDIEEDEKYKRLLMKYFQSGNLNFLLGAGASRPAINVDGNLEKELKYLADKNERFEYPIKKHQFLSTLQAVQNELISDENLSEGSDFTLKSYKNFILTLVNLLIKRNNTLLAKKCNIFTTNYDMFLEKSSEDIYPLHVNDGFSRDSSLNNKFKFSTNNFSIGTYTIGDYYKSDIPTINIIKLHGSLSWQCIGDDIFYRNLKLSDDDISIEKLSETYFNSIVLPVKNKHEDTVLMRYYDLLRIYSNELDKENSVLLTLGFSFKDEHILEITKRSLKNPTLELIIFAYNQDDIDFFKNTFEKFINVKIIHGSILNIDLAQLSEILGGIIPNET